MLKSITRRKKKYIFLDYLIVLFTTLYLRIRTVDRDFYSSLQPNYLQLLTILFGLMFAKIGRVWCIFICVNLNLLSIYLLGISNYVVLVSSIYTLTYDCLILLVICHSLNVFRDKTIEALTICYQIGNCLELAQLFINFKYFKYFLFILIVLLSLLLQRCRQLPQSNYFIVIKHLCNIKIVLQQSIILLYTLFAAINFYFFIHVVTSSWIRYIVLFIYPIFLLPIRSYLYVIETRIQLANTFLFIFLSLDFWGTFYIASSLFPYVFMEQFILFHDIIYEIDPKISSIIKYVNYDPIVLIHYIFLKNSYVYYNSYVEYKYIIIILSTIIGTLQFMKQKNFLKCFTNKENPYNNSYDQFESARNDDTVF